MIRWFKIKNTIDSMKLYALCGSNKYTNEMSMILFNHKITKW